MNCLNCSKSELTAQRLRELLHYDPQTGVFTRLETTSFQRKRLIGKPCGCISKGNGYIAISVDGRSYRGHRLAWLYVHGEWPAVVDHINRNRSDNRIDNLRNVTQAINVQNSETPMPSSKSGIRGVSWSVERKRWVAAISVNNKVRPLGRFMTQAEAHAAYLKARKEFHVGLIS